MAIRKLDLNTVRDIVDSEGLGYAIQHYMSGSSIAHPQLAVLWDEAKDRLTRIEKILERDDDDA